MDKNTIYQIYGTNYTEMTRQLLEEADLAGEIYAAAKGTRIGIKPNLVSSTPASYGATTHPEVTAGIIEYLQARGFDDIVICEGSWVGDKTEEAFEYCGYNDLAKKYGVKLLDTQKDGSMTADAAGMELHICKCLSDIDFLINVPVLKGHCQTKITCALKNMKGLIPNSEKRRFHSLGLHKPIAHLNTVIRPDFIVIDHICGDPDFEEGGNPMVRNCIMAAKDPVLTDALTCRILNYQPEEVAYIKLAERLGVGSADLDQLHLITLNAPADHTPESSSDTAAAAHKLLEINYAVNEIDSCSACYSALIEALDRLKQEGLLRTLTEDLHVRFCIGQGYRTAGVPSKAAESEYRYIGIGNCTHTFPQFIPGCPPAAEDIYQYLRETLLFSVSP